MFLDTHYQYHSKLEDSQQIEDGNWFDEVDQNIFTFKHLVHNYIQDNEENRSRKSSKSSKSKKSSVSSGSRSSGPSISMKEQTIKEKVRLADLMTEASYLKQKKLQELSVEELKIKIEIEKAKARVKIMEGGEQKFGEMANQEDLGNKPSEKLKHPEKDLNYLCENSCRFLGASTTEDNQHHSKPAAENKSHDEGQEGVANMICKLFQQQGAP